jgi:catalase
MSRESKRPPLSYASGTPVTDNLNIQTAGPRGPALLQGVWLIEKIAHFSREVIPERRMHTKGSGADALDFNTRYHPLYQGQDLLVDRQKDPDVRRSAGGSATSEPLVAGRDK